MTKTNFYPRNSRQKNKGFTILEVMAAIFILTIGIGGAFLLVRQSLSAASINKNRLIAAYLAQEGIEIVRNIRDTNWLEKRTNPLLSWDDGLGSGDWRADASTTALTTAFATGTCLKVDSNQMYNYTVGSSTSFQRKISLRNTGLNQKEVKVTVFWSERGRTHSLSALEYLQNWYEK